ncbi:MAG TPA: heme-binding protein, partial [Thermodesulfobacteriota bacterium]
MRLSPLARAALAAACAVALALPAWAQRPPAGGLAAEMAAGAAAPEPAPARLPTERVLPMAIAQEAAAAAVAACSKGGHRVSAAVADRAGNLRVLLRDDGAGPH